MSDIAAFKAAIRAAPEDDTNRGALADWLEEDGQSEAASRLRWWIAVRKQVRERIADGSPATDLPVGAETTRIIHTIPTAWACLLYSVAVLRQSIAVRPTPRRSTFDTSVRIALHTAELHALLLATDAELETESRAFSTQWRRIDGIAVSVATRTVLVRFESVRDALVS